MVYINLLPIRKIKKLLRAKQQIYGLSTAFGITILILIAYLLIQSGNLSALTQEIANLEEEKKRHTKVLAQIKTIEESKKLLEKQIGIINQLNKSSDLTVRILDEVAKYTPSSRMWLTSLTQSGQNLQLSGMALDNRTIASYLDELRKSPFVNDINLSSASLQQFAGRKLKTFSITATVSVPQEDVAATTPQQ